jgi:hypothetical protein
MVVHFLTSVAGLERWSDYIPVKLVQGGPENSYSGTIDVAVIPSLTADTQAWKEYIPVYADDSATDAWTVNNIGYIPYNYALFNDAAMQLDLTNGAALDPRITFSRTTNATVTGSNGLIQYAPHNLLTFSEQFDNAAWSKTGVTVSANTVAAPDGTTTADSLAFVAAPSNAFSYQSVATGAVTGRTFTFSCWLWSLTGKANIALRMAGLITGADSVVSVVTLSSTPTRVSITRTFTSADTFLSCGFDNRTVFGADGLAGDVVVWGAQLELGSTATTYNPTTVKNLLGFTEHFDAAAWTKSNSFVQTNLLTNSEQFDNAGWTKTDITVAANSVTAPNGTATADTITEGTGGAALVQQGFAVSAGATTTFSLSVKPNENNEWVRLTIAGASPATDFVRGWFNVVTGAVGSTSVGGVGTAAAVSIVPEGNGFYRCSLTGALSGATSYQVFIASASADASVARVNNASYYLWGAQLVQGTTPGDYKATYAAAAAVGYTDIYGQPFALKLVENTANSAHAVLQIPSSTASTAYTVSAYLKAGERTWAQVIDNGASGANAYFNLETGATGAVSVGSTATITAVGNGWYRCALTFTTAVAQTAANIQFRIATANGVNAYTGDGTSGIYIFGAQLSDSASVDPYVYQPVAASASTAYYGPRFDYDPVTLAPKGLLIEEQRTQLLLYSNLPSDTSFGLLDNATKTASQTGPDGSANANLLNEGTATAIHQFRTTTGNLLTPPANTDFTVSFFVKDVDTQYVAIAMFGAFNNYRTVEFDLTAGTVNRNAGANVTLVASSITSIGNSWYRCVVTYNTADTTTKSIRIGFSDGTASLASTTGNLPSITGTSRTFFLFGPQAELGAFATSYIPSVASQVTRAADSASMIGNNFARWYNVNEGTIYSEANRFSNAATFPAVFQIDDGTDSNRINTEIRNTTGTVFGSAILNGSNVAGLGSAAVGSSYAKLAFTFKVNDFAFSHNGTTALTDTSGGVPFVNAALLGARRTVGVSQFLNGTISRIAYYPRRLANSELQGITS